jgi:hypothetical protein
VTTVLIRGPELEMAQRLVSYAAPARTGQRAAARPGHVIEGTHMAAVASPPTDIVDQWGMQSFPASDPPANW